MDFFGANVLKVNERGIREGLILRGLRRQQVVPEAGTPRSWRSSVLEFGCSCRFDELHSLQVTRLSLAVFDALSSRFGFTTNERRLLEAAALLHDVGHFINYSSHHKHSYHLIRHADLFDFTSRERELIANIARYHRKSLPKKKHDPFIRLAMEDRLLVARLAGIVRLCDGLDRRHNSIVKELECSLSADSVGLMLVGREEMSVETFGAKAKGALFMAAFGLMLDIRQVEPATAEKRRRPDASGRNPSICVNGYGELAVSA
jgi:exopolyphosphatase/guanosine-5'-triphosphate,3'-diphosphate pyrophosphatase